MVIHTYVCTAGSESEDPTGIGKSRWLVCSKIRYDMQILQGISFLLLRAYEG